MIRAALDVVVTAVRAIQVFVAAGLVLGVIALIPGAPSVAEFQQALAGLHDVSQTVVRSAFAAAR